MAVGFSYKTFQLQNLYINIIQICHFALIIFSHQANEYILKWTALITPEISIINLLSQNTNARFFYNNNTLDNFRHFCFMIRQAFQREL